MSLNFNVDPYFDDFSSSKNFHRVLFKPGVAVQARELTQAQTILQDQITKFADNIFKQNSPVTGGQVTTNFNCYYIKLKNTYNNVVFDVTEFNGLLVQNNVGTVRARVLSTVASISGDPPTLIVSYLSGGHFVDNDIIYDTASNKAVQAVATESTGLSSVASISDGVFYVLGNFVQVTPSTVVLSKYSPAPSLRIGLTITETIVDYINDPSLLDPAIGASNYQAPGADRYFISLTLDTRPLRFGDDDNFIELVRIENGSVYKMVDGSVYATIDDYFAKRDYETNGDYVVNDFKITPKTNAADSSNNTYILSVGKGLAYVHGYRVENPAPVDLITNRAREIETQNNNPIYINYGNYLYVDNVRGNTNFFDITTSQPIDIHCVAAKDISTSNVNSYISTLVGTARIRNIEYDFDTGGAANVSSYVYKASLFDVSANTLSANVVSATSNTVILPQTFSSADGAYVGVDIVITEGPNTGDFNTIAAYNGNLRTATLARSWTSTVTSDSVFVLNFDIKDAESIVYANKSSYPASIVSSASINSAGKVGGVSSGYAVLQNSSVPEMIFNVGSPYISNLKGTSYTTTQEFRNISFTTVGMSVSAQLNYEGEYLDIIRHFGTPGTTLSNDLVKQNFIIVVTNKGANASLNVGDVLSWTTPNRTVTLDEDASIATLSASDLSPFTATVVVKVFVENADGTSHILRIKNYIQANTQTSISDLTPGVTQVNTYTYVDDAALTSTGQVYVRHGGLVPPGGKQSLYLSDVKTIVGIIDTKNPATRPTLAMMFDGAYDVTSNYIFDNGQRDGYYDHAYITLRPGAPQPLGNLLILTNYYQHSGGDGYFSKLSYTDVATLDDRYESIPSYNSLNGTKYYLRDCIDFRPSRLNATSNFSFRYANPGDVIKYGSLYPVDGTVFTTDSSFYLPRMDKLVLTKDRNLQIIEGSSSLSPLMPTEPDGSLVLANLTHRPYTGFLPTEAPPSALPDLSIQKVQHKRYTMQDIAGIDNKINTLTYYTSLSLLEKDAQSLQISDAFGLNRFKNGILVDDFSGYSAADTYNNDFYAGINRRTKKMTSGQLVTNIPLKDINLTNNMGRLDTSSINYSINSDGLINYFTLPYTTSNLTSQKIASRTVNVNPFAFSLTEGVTILSPNMDNWVDNTKEPSLLITDPNLKVFRSSDTVNMLQVGDWKTISSTTVVDSTASGSSTSQTWWENHDFSLDVGFGLGHGTVTTTTESWTSTTFRTNTLQEQANILGFYRDIGNTYNISNGYITDISILPWIRAQQVVVRTSGLLHNSTLHTFFDGVNVDNYVRKCNVIELSGATGTFRTEDTIGYLSAGTFTPTGRIVGIFNYADNDRLRLYIAADQFTSVYAANNILNNGFFNSNGNYTHSTASGTIISTDHFGGRVKNVPSSTSVKLNDLASSIDNYYVGNTLYILSGTGIGQNAVITAYSGSTKLANVATPLTCANNDIYSMGSFKSDESGHFYSIFNLPGGKFHTGERVFRIDNRIENNASSATTWSESTFYATGLATKSQTLDFGASPAGAKNTFVQTNNRTLVTFNTVTTSNQTSSVADWDPVAQTFIIDSKNYPNGAFIKSVKLFFSSKPTIDDSPVSLFVVGTLNGYPNGNTLDHGIVTLTKDKIKVSDTPQYLDPEAYTNFEFEVPIYIQPDVLYAFIVKSSSNEYNLWTASNGDTAKASSVKNLPTDPLPSTITKISSAPYVGGLFISQNSQTWTADQNQSLMFVMDRCVFDITKQPNIRYTVPKLMPQRTLFEDSVEYFLDSNNIISTISTSNQSLIADAFNVTTTDFTPTLTNIVYTYSATLLNGSQTSPTTINPGKYGTAMNQDLLLDDSRGERIVDANNSTSFSVYAKLQSISDAVSPVVSDAGLSVYVIENNINNCELSNDLITITSTGSSYNANTTSVTISPPTGLSGTQAYADVIIENGSVSSVYITIPGSGYIETPTITIFDANSAPGTGATVAIRGETSPFGGPAKSKYLTKKVALTDGFDSGDLNVYLTAYRPVGTEIYVYYKILNRNDTSKFEDSNWQLMNMIKNSGALYSQNRNDVYEYIFAPGTDGSDQGFVSYTSKGQLYTTFSQFAIKVVMVTTDKTRVPYVNDLRCIALPPNVNTTF